ncbi:glycosyltransferase, putative [gamma proteobacterium NOR5-3]|nr:glycosyltransferase, putative [gamma proteobacterium NOR5-3]
MSIVSKPKALVAGIHHWHSVSKVGTHYIVEYLLQQNFEVAYISAPITPLHRLLPLTEDLNQRKNNNALGGEWSSDGSLWHYVPYALVAPDSRPLLSSALVIDHWQKTTIPNIVSNVASQGFANVDLLLLDTPFQPFWLDDVSYQRSAYRVADNTNGFMGNGAACAASEAQIIRSVNKVFTASSSLLDYAKTKGARAPSLLPNGVNLSRFSDAPVPSTVLSDMHGPVAVYVGAISYWFDHDAVVALAQARPDLTILLIGPVDAPEPRYASLANVKLLGPQPHDTVPAYLAAADVGLIPFCANRFPELINDVNPLKLYEYMAAGLPVVASHWRQLQSLQSPARLVSDIPTFINEVSRALAEKSDGAKERDFARGFDWSETLAPLGNWLSDEGLQPHGESERSSSRGQM